jgi:hypothetical protein
VRLNVTARLDSGNIVGVVAEIERDLEAALQPGRFVEERYCYRFTQRLERVAERIEMDLVAAPARAVDLLALFIAACHEKAGEVDDSGADLAAFVQELFGRWISAHLAAASELEEIVGLLVQWFENDPFGFCHRIDEVVLGAGDEELAEAFLRKAIERYESLRTHPDSLDRSGAMAGLVWNWTEALKRIYVSRRDPMAYVAVCGDRLTEDDCLKVAEVYVDKGQDGKALEWVERGIVEHARKTWGNVCTHDLPKLQRQLLVRLGREDEALSSAWRQFVYQVDSWSLSQVLEYAPERERDEWRERCLERADKADIHRAVTLYVEAADAKRLVRRLRAANEDERRVLGELDGESAATLMEELDPEMSAWVYFDLALQILKNRRSRHYGVALRYLAAVCRCLHAAGMGNQWKQLVEEIEEDHSRKRLFIGRFRDLVEGRKPQKPPSMLDRARLRLKKYES